MMMYIVIAIVALFVVFLCFALAVASFSFENFNENLNKTRQYNNSCGIKTLDYVGEINKKYFGNQIKVARCEEFNDHYGNGTIALSDKTMSSNSLASLAIVSHELGHARQDGTGDVLLKHWKRKRTGKMIGFLFMPFMIAGAVLSLLNVFGVLKELYWLFAGLGCVCFAVFIFCFALFLKYKEIKIEKQASDYAIEFLKEILTDPELKICKDFLNSARLTYWASLFKTMLSWTMLTKKDSMFS